MKQLLIALMLLLVPTSIFAAKPVGNLYHVPVPKTPNGDTLSLSQVKQAIFAGCAVKGWAPSSIEGNRISAEIYVRSHWAQVIISYDEKEYSIVYKNSRNLDYNGRKETIHRNYNKWVILLSQAIQAELIKSSQVSGF